MIKLSHKILIFLSIASTIGSGSCAQRLARLYAPRHPGLEQAMEEQTPIQFTKTDIQSSERESADFDDQLKKLIRRRDFVGLDAAADKFRNDPERFIGGGWKIHSLYVFTSSPLVDKPSEADWRSHIKYLQDWKRAMPDSIAARSALAKAYIGFAWLARGSDYADKVPASAWPIVQERLNAARDEVVQASALKGRCYGYFEVLLDLGRTQGWSKSEYDEAFNQAINYDPTYQYFYALKAENLLPRWKGRPGDWERYADDVRKTVGGNDGLKFYYWIVITMTRNHFYGFFNENHPSWENTKKGFLLCEQDYGLTRHQLNEFARLAVDSNDHQALCETFKQFTDESAYDPSSWQSHAAFVDLKNFGMDSCNLKQDPRQAR